jgi:sugar phosphate permease
MVEAARRAHYGWVIVVVTFAALLLAAGVRGAPGVLIKPFEAEFGWDRASISLAVAVSLIAFGLGGPLGGTIADRFGPRRVLVAGLGLIAIGLAGMLVQRELWHLHLLWGLTVGVGTGAAGNVLGATIAHRWFRSYRGLVIGLFSGAGSAGQLVFVPSMMALVVIAGWRGAVLLLAASAALLLVPVLIWLRDRPADLGLRPVGQIGEASAAERAEDARTTPLASAARTRDFWLLTGSFFICGYTSNGLIGTHLIPHAVEHGFTEVTAAGTVGLMGAMNIVGTLASGWLTDRYDNRKLLAAYYGFRSLAILALPFIVEVPMLLLFAVVYGLDWIATVPPTANLTATIFGRASLGTVYGWIFFGHMVGAALAAYAGGFFRNVLGDYHMVFLSAAGLGFVAVALSLSITPSRARVAEPAPAY